MGLVGLSRPKLVSRRNWSVKDHAGQKLTYVYFEEEPGWRSSAKLLTRDEALGRGACFGFCNQSCLDMPILNRMGASLAGRSGGQCAIQLSSGMIGGGTPTSTRLGSIAKY
jgi:hypothetical protein